MDDKDNNDKKNKPVVVFQAWNFRNFRKKDRQNRFQGEISKF